MPFQNASNAITEDESILVKLFKNNNIFSVITRLKKLYA